jgi:GntR family transcriptional repressor for pyruvate dehydrogenase complex
MTTSNDTATSTSEGIVEALVFQPVTGSRSALEVADQLVYAIASGIYPEGARLPTVERLADLMRVSKPTIGEAVRLLADAKVIQPRRGAYGGTVVLTSDIPLQLLKLSRPRRARTLTELCEARRPVEIALVRLAAQRATDADFQQLELANEMLVAAKNRREWARANNLFHYGIGRAARNPHLAFFQREVLEELAILLDGYHERYAVRERTIQEHHDTLAALRTGDPDVAERAMDGQLREFEELAPEFDRKLRTTKARRRRAKGS